MSYNLNPEDNNQLLLPAYTAALFVWEIQYSVLNF